MEVNLPDYYISFGLEHSMSICISTGYKINSSLYSFPLITDIPRFVIVISQVLLFSYLD